MTAPGGSANAAPTPTIPSAIDITGGMGITPDPTGGNIARKLNG